MNGFGAIGEFAIGELVDWQWQFRYPVGSKPTSSSQRYFTFRDSLPEEEEVKFASYYQGGSPDTIADTTDNATISLDTEWIDPEGIASLSSNEIVVAIKGWYEVYYSVSVTASSLAFNGALTFSLSAIPSASDMRRGYATAMGIFDDFIEFGPMLIEATTDNFHIGPIKMSNHSGDSVDVYVFEFTVVKLGDHA